MFRDREDAAGQLALKLRQRPLHDPLVLGIPRGGVDAHSISRSVGGVLLDRSVSLIGKER